MEKGLWASKYGNKLNNLLTFSDFISNWKAEQAKKTKRTDTGLDIIKEEVKEIIPEGLPEEDFDKYTTRNMGVEEKIEKIKEIIYDLDEDYIDEIVNYLREVLLEMEQQGFVDEETTDALDDKHDGDWVSWIIDVIELPDFDEGALNGVLDIAAYSKETIKELEGEEDYDKDFEEEYDEEEFSEEDEN